MKIEQCFHGLDKRGGDGFIASSSGFSKADLWVIGNMVRMPQLDGDFDGTLSVYMLDKKRIAVQYMSEDADQSGRKWHFAHILRFYKKDYEQLKANPFVLLRSGLLKRETDYERHAPIIDWAMDSPLEFETCWEILNGESWESLLNAFLAPKRAYAFLDSNVFDKRNILMETLLSAIPLYLRSRSSFTTSLWSPEEKSEKNLQASHVSLQEDASFYCMGFNLVVSDLESFRVPDGHGYVEIGPQKNEISDIPSQSLAHQIRQCLDEKKSPTSWIALLELPDLKDASADELNHFWSLKETLESDQLTVNEVVECRVRYMQLNARVKDIESRIKRLLRDHAQDIEPLDQGSRKKLADVMVEDGLYDDFFEGLKLWASDAGGEFLTFIKWFREHNGLRAQDNIEIRDLRLKLILEEPSDKFESEFAFWMDDVDHSGLPELIEHHDERFWDADRWSEYYGFWFLNNVDTMAEILKLLWRVNRKRKKNTFLKKLIDYAYESEDIKTVSRLWIMYVQEIKDAQLMDFINQPQLTRAVLDNKSVGVRLVERFFQQNNLQLHSKLLSWCKENEEERAVLLSAWFQYVLKQQNVSSEMQKLAVETACSLKPSSIPESNFSYWMSLKQFDAADWGQSVLNAAISEKQRKDWLVSCAENRELEAMKTNELLEDQLYPLLRYCCDVSDLKDFFGSSLKLLSPKKVRKWLRYCIEQKFPKSLAVSFVVVEEDNRIDKKYLKKLLRNEYFVPPYYDFFDDVKKRIKSLNKKSYWITIFEEIDPRLQESEDYEEVPVNSNQEEFNQPKTPSHEEKPLDNEFSMKFLAIYTMLLVIISLGVGLFVGRRYMSPPRPEEAGTVQEAIETAKDDLEMGEEVDEDFSEVQVDETPVVTDEEETLEQVEKGKEWDDTAEDQTDLTKKFDETDNDLSEAPDSIGKGEETAEKQDFIEGLRMISDAEYAPLGGLALGSSDAQAAQKEASESKGLPLEVECEFSGMRFRLIPSGELTNQFIGDRQSEIIKEWEDFDEPFYMGMYPLTEQEYEKVMGPNPGQNKDDLLPVVNISWDDADEFCQKLSDQTGLDVRIPSEAQWVYAVRAGTVSPFYFGDDLDGLSQYGWHAGNSGRRRRNVGLKKPNAWGLYDMHGNVWEWCKELDQGSNGDIPEEKLAADHEMSQHRVLRGGSWKEKPQNCGSEARYGYYQTHQDEDIGLRIIIEISSVQ